MDSWLSATHVDAVSIQIVLAGHSGLGRRCLQQGGGACHRLLLLFGCLLLPIPPLLVFALATGALPSPRLDLLQKAIWWHGGTYNYTSTVCLICSDGATMWPTTLTGSKCLWNAKFLTIKNKLVNWKVHVLNMKRYTGVIGKNLRLNISLDCQLSKITSHAVTNPATPPILNPDTPPSLNLQCNGYNIAQP